MFEPPKRPNEERYYGFDFKNQRMLDGRFLSQGSVTLVAAEYTITVVSGTDANPEDMIADGGVYITGTRTTRLFKRGVLGVRYMVHCLGELSDGQKIELCEELLVDNC